ncbi:hypothetical protein ACFL5M_05535, partial [Candidatus Neomarinimicrobiota bacterium]
GISVRGVYRQPADLLRLDSDAYLGPPENVRAGRIGLLYRWKSQRPHREMAYLPRNGQGLRIRYHLVSSAIYGDFDYRRTTVEYFTHWIVAPGPAVLFLHGKGSSLTGRTPSQDRVALLGDPPVHLNPGSALGFLLPFVEVPVFHHLRGLERPVLGAAAISGTIELRVPLLAKPVIKVIGLEVGQITAALFADLGQVWEAGNFASGSPRTTAGMEFKGNILTGSLPLLTLAWGQAGGSDAWRKGDPVAYLELGLVSPF